MATNGTVPPETEAALVVWVSRVFYCVYVSVKVNDV